MTTDADDRDADLHRAEQFVSRWEDGEQNGCKAVASEALAIFADPRTIMHLLRLHQPAIYHEVRGQMVAAVACGCEERET